MGRKFEVRKESMQKSGLRKSKLYARYGKEIFMSAKQGGHNLDSNLALKHLIERAKKEEVPMDIIERNIKKAESSDASDYEPIRYEGFGPSGSAFLIDCLSDNVNRTVGEVRYCFTKIHSKMGVKGSVEHMFEHLSILEVDQVLEDDLLETLLNTDIDVHDITSLDQGFEIIADGYDLDTIEHAFREASFNIVSSKRGWFAKDMITLNQDDQETLETFLNMVNDIDDVQAVYHNVDVTGNDEKA